jgi:Uma2 family endonuclease
MTKPTPLSAPPPEVDYPDSDGQPMADNTLQFRWIVTLQGGLDALFDNQDVFVAGDLLWYPVQGDNTIANAPDTMVVFGRPKGDRGSYRQWEEAGIAPQVVFEVASPSNRKGVLRKKFQFYDRYGVEEYYLYNPEKGKLKGWLRKGTHLKPIADMAGWRSPRLGIRFEVRNRQLEVYEPGGRKFASYVELARQRAQEEQEKEQAQARAEAAQAQAEQERRDKEAAQAQADAARAQADQERRDKEAAQARLKQLEAELRNLRKDSHG